jgi:hypothetical protein
MNPQEQIQIEQELGQWANPISLSDHALHLKLEKSDTNLELKLPNLEKEVILLARPNGFQLFSHYRNEIRRDFSINNSTIKSVQLLPSFTPDKRPGISFKYILFSIVIFGTIGVLSSERPNIILWILLGLTFGLTLSIIFKTTYRQNLIMMINENERDSFLLFTIDKRQRQSCIDFFNRFMKEKFSA